MILTAADVTSNVLTVGQLSVFTMTPARPVTINQIAADNLPDKLISIHVTNNLVTWQNGTKLKLRSSVNFTTPGAGSWHTFQIKPGGVAYETGRVEY